MLTPDDSEKGRAIDKATDAVGGIKSRTHEKVDAVVTAAEGAPERSGDIAETMGQKAME